MYQPGEIVLVNEIRQLSTFRELEAAGEPGSLDDILEAISRHLEIMLAGSHEKLLQLLYRVDVPEAAAREAFAGFSGKELAQKLAGLILQRMIQKAETRLKYKDGTL